MGSIWQRVSHSHSPRSVEEQQPMLGHLPGWRMGLIWLAANLVVTTQLTGTLFVPALPWLDAILLILVGTVFGAVILVLVGNMGTRTGLPTMALARGAFGIRGSLLPVTANLVVLMGWSWVQAMLGGLALNQLLLAWTGLSAPMLCAVTVQVCVVFLVLFGHSAIARVEPWLAATMFSLLAYLCWIAFSRFSLTDYMTLPAQPAVGWTPTLVFDVVFATAISWTVLSADITRMARSQKAGIVGTSIGYVLSTLFSMIVGATAIAFILLAGGEAAPFDPVAVIAAFGWPLALMIVLSVIATNTMVLYGMTATSLHSMRTRSVGYLATVLILGALSIAGATLFALLEQFTDFLVAIGTLFIPVFAIMLADYYLLHRGAYDRDILCDHGGRYWYWKGINRWAIIVWLVSVLFSLWLNYMVTSPLGATLPTLVLAFVAYLLPFLIPGWRPQAAGSSVHLATALPGSDD